MKKVFSLALVAGMFAFASCETKPAETETEVTTEAETVETAEPTTLEGDSAAVTTDAAADTAVAPVQ